MNKIFGRAGDEKWLIGYKKRRVTMRKKLIVYFNSLRINEAMNSNVLYFSLFRNVFVLNRAYPWQNIFTNLQIPSKMRPMYPLIFIFLFWFDEIPLLPLVTRKFLETYEKDDLVLWKMSRNPPAKKKLNYLTFRDTVGQWYSKGLKIKLLKISYQIARSSKLAQDRGMVVWLNV